MKRIFISHTTRDGAEAAQSLVAAFEAAGRDCWIAPRDVMAAVPYPGQIVNAIRESCGLVLLLTPGANQSPDVLQEVQCAHDERKLIAALVVLDTEPSDDLGYFLRVRHRIAWTDAQTAAAALGAVFASADGSPESAAPSQSSSENDADAVRSFGTAGTEGSSEPRIDSLGNRAVANGETKMALSYPSSGPSRNEAFGSAGSFGEVGRLFDDARSHGWRIIVNLGLSGDGKSSFIARLVRTLEASGLHAYECSAAGELTHIMPGLEYRLPRTRIHSTFLWHIQASGSRPSWLVVVCPREQIDSNFADRALLYDSYYNLMLMALAQADALILTMDGNSIEEKGGARLDVAYASIINELVRILPWLHHWKRCHPEVTGVDRMLKELRDAHAGDPLCADNGGVRKVNIPVLLAITKAGKVLPSAHHSAFAHVEADAVKFAERHLSLTFERAKCLSAYRWQLCGPFAGTSAEEDESGEWPTDRVDINGASFGMEEASKWLESQLAPRGPWSRLLRRFKGRQ